MLRSALRQERLDRLAARAEPWAIGGVVVAGTAWQVTGLPSLVVAILLFSYVLWRLNRERVRLRDQLEAALRDRAVMEDALRRSQRMEVIGRLTSGIAHDFNNHLTVISSNVELVRRRLDSGQERLVGHLDATLQGVQRAAALTGRLLSFTPESPTEPEVVDVARLLGGLSDLLGRTLGESVALEVRLPDDCWFVWVDARQMENALLSLAVNARERVSAGGVLSLAVSNVHLNQTFAATQSGVLPGDYVRIVFSELTLVDPTLMKQAEPALDWRSADNLAAAGLSMARGFVRQAGGCLLWSGSAAETPSLRLFLPRYHPAAPARRPSRRHSDAPLTILVVEDDPAVRSVCVEALRDLDYSVLEAPDAMEAFRLIADHGGIDLLFTDLGLPGASAAAPWRTRREMSMPASGRCSPPAILRMSCRNWAIPRCCQSPSTRCSLPIR